MIPRALTGPRCAAAAPGAAATLCAAVFVCGPVHAAEPPETIVITGPRVPEAAAELPMSVDRLDQQQIQQGQLQVNLSESLDMVPGVNAQERQNYAQDLQVSVRGFGARSSFGVRGVRLYADGIPATMPDGQGQFSHFDLGSAERIEVLRGPFSALYGNSSGGVIALFTEDGASPGQHRRERLGRQLGTQRYAIKFMGAAGWRELRSPMPRTSPPTDIATTARPSATSSTPRPRGNWARIPSLRW